MFVCGAGRNIKGIKGEKQDGPGEEDAQGLCLSEAAIKMTAVPTFDLIISVFSKVQLVSFKPHLGLAEHT